MSPFYYWSKYMNEKWTIYGKKADFYQIGEKFNIDPVIARVIRNRDVIGEAEMEAYLHPKLSDLHDPMLMKDMKWALDIFQRKIHEGKKIRIVSDYDVDGVMSNYILLKGLLRLGAVVDYEIPDRVEDGYGINEKIIQAAYDDGVDTIVTCDNGIAAGAQVEYAKKLGMTIIVTDHHDVPFTEGEDGTKTYRIPEAHAVVNPKQIDCDYPFKGLCGAGVAFKVMEALYERMGVAGEEIYEFLQFVAIATVCDVMVLQGENRCLVTYGLNQLNQTEHVGLKALLTVNELTGKKVASYHLGFVLGPCINATGRLESAKQSLDLLMEADTEKALEKAQKLKEINEERKEMTKAYTQTAISLIEDAPWKEDRVLVVELPDCHESIAGIIAGRIREKYYKPVLVITDGKDGIAKGSARSVEGYDMYEALNACSELLLKFGGHTMAAGFSLEKEQIAPLRTALNEKCRLTQEDLTPKFMIDVPMPIDYIRFDFIEQLEVLEPFGVGNEKPVFAQSGLKVMSAKILGKEGKLLKLELESAEGALMEGIYFKPEEFVNHIKEWFGEDECDQMLHGWLNQVKLDIAYYPSVNEFNGLRAMQIVIQKYRKSTEE